MVINARGRINTRSRKDGVTRRRNVGTMMKREHIYSYKLDDHLHLRLKDEACEALCY